MSSRFDDVTDAFYRGKDEEHHRKSGVTNFVVRYGADRMKQLLLVSLPLSYVTVAVYFGLLEFLPLVTAFSAYVVYLLVSWEGENALVYKLDAANGLYLISLGVVFFYQF